MIKEALGTFTIIAIVLVVSSAYFTWQIRGAVSSAEIATLEQTVKQLEVSRDSLQIIFQQKTSSLETQIETLSRQVEDAGKKAALLTNNHVKTPSQGSRIEMYPIRKRLRPPSIGFDIGFLNSGDAPATAPLKIWKSYITENKPSANEIDAIFEKLYQQAKGYEVDPKSTELWPGKAHWLTMAVQQGAEKIDDVLHGNAKMYIFVLVAYTDLDDLHGPLKFTEGCFYTFKDQAIHNCKRRNRILLKGRR